MKMDLNLKQNKFLIFLIILCSVIPRISSVLSFTYPQSTTLSTGEILVVERDGIYICDSNFNSINKTVKTFPDEDKITTLSKLSTTVIKKSSFAILIFSNYKIYLVGTTTGNLLAQSTGKLITGEEPEYVDLAYYYIVNSQFFFAMAYIDSNNYLTIKYYEYKSDGSIAPYNSCSLNNVTRAYYQGNYRFDFQNKGLSCENLKDFSYSSYSYITCFIIAKNGENDYLIPIIFEKQSTGLAYKEIYNYMPYININNVKQIKADSDVDTNYIYVCYVTGENVGKCREFYLDSSISKGVFADTITTFDEKCRADIYGMRVNYIFETKKVLFSCSDLDGSIQVKILDQTGKPLYFKYEGCDDISGYSVIYLNSKTNYYVVSDVTCPKGKIPYDILIEPSGHVPVVVTIPVTEKVVTTEIVVPSTIASTIITEKVIETTNKEVVVETTNKIIETTQQENIVETTNKIIETTQQENIIESTNKIIETTIQKIPETSIITEKITETERQTTYITIETTGKEKNENIETTNIETQIANNCSEKCLECISEKECTKCNKNKGYYPIELSEETADLGLLRIVECITEEIKEKNYPNFYFDNETESFKACYENCATCYGAGDGNNNNCKTCEPGYIPHPEYENSKDCVSKPHSLYAIINGQYTDLNSDRCPEEYIFLVEEKGKCIEDCKKDPKYNYAYDEHCYMSPPENTNDDDHDFICKDNPNICIVTKKILYTGNRTITDEEIEILTYKYAKEYNYTNNHISIYENDIYKITIYKNGECISDLGILSKLIDFGTCYTDIHTKYSFDENTNLIVVNIETKPGKEAYKKIPSYALYNPQNGENLHYENECKDQKVTIQNNLTEEFNNSKVSLGDLRLMADQGLDLFDPTCPFYNDLCTHYPDLINKDIPLKKRVLAYYPDIKLCDDHCDLTYVFLNNQTAKCECSISEEGGGKDKLKENALYENELGVFEEFIYSTNINVIKCYKDIFKPEYIKKNYGGFIILSLIFIQILCTLAYCFKSRLYLKKFFFSITNKYLNYLKAKDPIKDISQKPPSDKEIINKINFPPRKRSKSVTKADIFKKKQNNNNNANLINNKNPKNKFDNTNSNDKLNVNKPNQKRKSYKSKTFKRFGNYSNSAKLSFDQSVSDNLMENISDDFDIYIEEFLKTDPEDMDYDDAIRRDKRTFCRYFLDKIQTQQILIDTFCYKEYLRPRPIKIMLFALQIELYFFINGLFYNEEYVTKIFELEKDSFANKTWRFLDNLFYAFIVGVIINYVIEFFFIKEKKLRVTLKREKNNLLILKYEMIQIIKDIQKRFLSFIIISFIISVFIWYHISCFNNVYTHMKEEWLIFSILIIACIQIISLITSLIETILRFLSFRFKSEKLYKLSLIFS